MPRLDEPPDARDIAADVDVVRSLRNARVDEAVAMQAEGSGHVQDNARAVGQRAESLIVFSVGRRSRGAPRPGFSSFFASRPAIAHRTPSGACRTKYSAAWRPVKPDAP